MVSRMIARMRPEVGRAFHHGRCSRDSAVISPGRRGRCTPTRNFEASKKFTKKFWRLWTEWTLLKWSDTLGLNKKRIRQWRRRLPFKEGTMTDGLSEPFSPNGEWSRREPSRVVESPNDAQFLVVGPSKSWSFLFDGPCFPSSSSNKATRRWPLEAGLFLFDFIHHTRR